MNINISGEVVRTSQLPKRIIGLGDYLVALNSSPLETSTVLVSDFVSFLNTQFATSLASLTDVSINGPLPGQALVFNGSYWVNQNLVSSLAGLSDVTIASLNPNQLLRYDGTSWKNWTPTFYSLPLGGTTLQYIDGTGALQTFPTSLPTSTVRHQVKAGVPITKGQAVYVTSADGTNMIVGLASNASEATSSKTMGLLDATVSTNGFANVVTEGLLTGLDTTAANAEGDPVWLGTGGNLIYGLVNKPYAPNHLVFIGIVTRRNANNGEIFVKVQNGFELQELHNVDALNPSNNDGIFYNSTTQLWEHKQISAVAPTPTLAQVTTAGNTTTNSITVGKTTVIHTPSNEDYIFRAESTQNRLELIHPGGGGATLQMTSTLNSGYTKEFIMTGKFKISTEYFGNAVYFGNSSTTYTIFTNTNNFAIGTTTDSGYKLDVNGTLRATGIIYADSTIDQPTNFGNKLLFMGSGNYSKIALADGTNWSLDYHSGTSVGNVGYHRFYTGSTSGWVERMRIDNSGNVGIGTSSPSSKFHVNIASSADFMLGTSSTLPAIIYSGGGYLMRWKNDASEVYINASSYTVLKSGANELVMRPTFIYVPSYNVGIGTTTDAGYKLDVNGTAALRGTTDVIGGTLRIASTGTLTQPSYITSHSDGGWNFTTYTHNRGAGVHYFTSNNGSASIFSASAREGVNINVNSLTTGNPFSISGTVNASSAIARGQLINTTLVAAANNDVLVGLDINPTFTNGAFTGVSNIGLRVSGQVLFNAYGAYNTVTPTLRIENVDTNNVAIQIKGNVANYKYYWIYDSQTTEGIYKSDQARIDFYGGTNVGFAFRNNYGRLFTIVGSTGNVLINTTTDSGYKLDVNGTGVFRGNLEVNAGANGGLFINNLYPRILFGKTGTPSWSIGADTENSGQFEIGTGAGFPYNTFTSRVYISSAGNVGIGTTSPTYKLEVFGGIRSAFVTTTTVHGEGNTLLLLSGLNGTNPGVNEARLHIGYNQNDPELRLNSGGIAVSTGKWTFLPQIWFAGGITSSHNIALTIDGMSNGVTSGVASEIVRFTQRGGQFANFYDAGAGLSEFRIWQQANSNNYIYLKPGQTSYFSTGSLVIGGTTDAGYKLDVNGTAVVRSGTLNLVDYYLGISGTCADVNIFNNCGSQGNIGFTLGGNRFFNIWQVTGSSSGNTSGTHSTLSSSPTYAWSSGNAISNHLLLAPTINNTGTYSGIFRGFYYNPTLTSLTGTTHRAIETTSGDVIFNGGNVGIGTTGLVPGYLLTINGGVSIAAGQSLSLDPSAGIYMVASSSQFRLYNNSIAALSVASTGNVLINTVTDAGYKLDVNGTTRLQDHLLFSSGKGIYASSASNTVLQSSLNYFTHNRVGSSGTLGFQISVVGNVQSFWRYNDATGDVEFGNANGSYHLGLYAGNTERVKILGSGNVGIGTTTPAYKLDVVGDVRFQKSNGANLYLSETGGNAGDVSGLYLTGNNSVWGGSVRYNVGPGGATNRLDFYHSLTGLGFSLISTGNVAIGTTTDNGYKLQVNGNAFIKGSGSTSGTTSLLVQNSAGTNLLQQKDNGELFIGTTASGLGQIVVPHDSVYGQRVFMKIQAGVNLMATQSNDGLVFKANYNIFDGSIYNNSGYFLGASTGIGTDTSAYFLSTQLQPYGGANSNLIHLNGGGRLQGGATGNYIQVSGNMLVDSSANILRGFYFNPTLSGAYSNANVFAVHSTYGGAYLNTATPNASAILQADSTTQGFLAPRLTTAQILAITSPAEGLQVYNTDLKTICFYNGTTWQRVTSTAM